MTFLREDENDRWDLPERPGLGAVPVGHLAYFLIMEGDIKDRFTGATYEWLTRPSAKEISEALEKVRVDPEPILKQIALMDAYGFVLDVNLYKENL